MTLFLLSLILGNIFLIIFSQVTITTFSNIQSNTYSSLAGGTTFMLDSSDLSSMTSTGFAFLIETSPATLLSAGNPTTTIATTPSTTTGTQQLLFDYNGSPMTLICPGNCQINYDWSMTPEAHRIVNRSASPNDIISFAGVIKFPSSQTNIIIETTSITNIASGNNVVFTIPGNFEAGYYLMALSIVDIGNYYKSTFMSTWSNNMVLYDFRCTPIISSLNTNVGSPQGQIITMNGYGWTPTTTNIVIFAGLTPCTVVSIQLNIIQCKILPDNYANIGFYVQSTGILLTVYATNSQALWQIHDEYFANDMTLGGWPASQITTQIVNDLNEELHQSAQYDAMIYEGFFKPPIDGSYRFYVSGSYQMQLYLSNTANSTDKTFLTQIASGEYIYNSYGTIKETAQISSFIPLLKNSFYRIVLLRNSPNYYTNIWTGVEISAAITYPYASTYFAYYNMAITYTAQQEIQQLTIYNWNTGTFRVVIYGYNPPVTGSLVCSRVSAAFDRSITAADLSSGLNAIFDYPPTVVRVPLDSSGNVQGSDTGAAGFQWTITINNYRNNWNGNRYSPTVEILTSDITPTAIMTELQPSIPVSGTFNLLYGSTTITNIPSSTDCYGLLNYMQQLPDYTRFFTCEYDGTFYEGRTYYLKFAGMLNAPMTFSIDDTNLVGGQSSTKPTGSTLLYATANNNSFHSPIPGDMLFTTSSIPQVHMEINGSPSKCPNQNCDYTINQAITPILESFSFSGSGLTISISNYASLTIAMVDITITFGGTQCPMTTINLPNFDCTFLNIPISTAIPVVHIQRIGYLINNVNLVSVTTSCLSGQIISAGLCYNCDVSCLSCNGIGPTGCTSCPGIQVLYNGGCYNCDASCQTCNGITASDCLTCPGTTKLYNGVCYNCDSSCLICNGIGPAACVTCPGVQVLYNGGCYNCDPSCQTCNGITASNCLTCAASKQLYNGACIICDTSCLTCNGLGPTACLTCYNPNVLLNGVCVSCDPSCQTCNGITASNCLTCSSNKLLYLGTCLSACPTGLCVDGAGTGCEACPVSCLGQIAYQGSCIDSCPTGTCLNTDSNTCDQCLQINTCSQNQLFYQNQCLETCPNGTYTNFVGNTCELCDQSCLTCENSKLFCTSCSSSWYFINNSCLRSCPLGTYVINNDTCYQCDSNLFPLILGLKSFCDNITKVSFSLVDLNNPTLFKLIFTSIYNTLTLKNLNDSISIKINKLNNEHYTWNLTNDFFTENEFFLNINYINCSFHKEEQLKMTLLLNITNFQTQNFLITNSQTENSLLTTGTCLTSNDEYYNSTSEKCQNYLIIDPILDYTVDPLKIKITLNIDDDYINKLISSLSKISIENLHKTEITNISVTTDLYITIFSTMPIIGNPKLTVDLSSITLYLRNTTKKLSTTQLFINLLDYYNLDEATKASINETSETSNNGNIILFFGMLANSIIGSQAGLLLKGLMLNDLIHLTKFINNNYPPNMIFLYLSRTSLSSWINLPKIDDSKNFDIPPLLRLYKISPYFLNNFGKELFQISLTYLIGLFCYLVLKRFVNKLPKRFAIIKNFYFFFAWDFSLIYMVSNFTKILVYSLIKLSFSKRFETITDKFDMITAILMLIFCLFLIFHFYLKIATNFTFGIFSDSPILKPIPNHSPENRKISNCTNLSVDHQMNHESDHKMLFSARRESRIPIVNLQNDIKNQEISEPIDPLLQPSKPIDVNNDPGLDSQQNSDPKDTKSDKMIFASVLKEKFSLTIKTCIINKNAGHETQKNPEINDYNNNMLFPIRREARMNSITMKASDVFNDVKSPLTSSMPNTGTLDLQGNQGQMTDKGGEMSSFNSLRSEPMKLKEMYAKTANFLRRKSVDLVKYIYMENLEERNNNILNMTKKETDIHKYYLIIELMRYILLTCFAILLYGHALIQIALIFSFNLIFFILTAVSNPFRKKYMFVITIINEFLINVCFLICLIFTVCDRNDCDFGLDQKMSMGWTFIAVDLILLYFMFLFNGFRIARGLLEKFKKSKTVVYPEKMNI